MKRQNDTAWGAGLILALALLLFGILVVAPGFAQQTVSADAPVPIETTDKPEAQNSTGPESAQKSDSSGNAISSDEADVRAALRAEQREREHGFALVNKDIENLNKNLETGFLKIEIYIALTALIITIIGFVAGGFSIRGVIKAEKRVADYIKQKDPEIKNMIRAEANKAAIDAVKWVLKETRAGEKTESSGGRGDPPASPAAQQIHIAAFKGDAAEIGRLVESDGSLLNKRDENGHTPLLVAAIRGAREAITKLVELGADVTAKSKNDVTALHVVAARGTVDAIEPLLKNGADINVRDKDGDTPLLMAAFNSALETIVKLVELGADVTAKNKNDVTALHVVAARGTVDAIEPLLKNGADINARDNDGDTPLDVAAGLGKYDVAGALQKRGGKHGKEF